MNFRYACLALITSLLLIAPVSYGIKIINTQLKTSHSVVTAKKPVTPNASPEALKLLQYL